MTPQAPSPGGSSSDHIDAHRLHAPDWHWRRRLRSHPPSHRVYKIVVGAVGLIVVVGGLIMVPFPGPGWLVVLFGVAIWASEFAWAHHLLQRGRRWLQLWTDWILAASWWVRSAVGVATLGLVTACFWVLLRVGGIPAFLPDQAENLLRSYAFL